MTVLTTLARRLKDVWSRRREDRPAFWPYDQAGFAYDASGR
jgi:hypothetical protein